MPPRSNNKKLNLMAAESDEDRISALSDWLIHHVLSFLTVREAVQTCLLARRWREIWKSMPVLRVAVDSRSPAESNKFVNYLLFFRDQTPLDEFVVTTSMAYNAFPDKVEPVRYLQMWIRYALMREVQELKVRVYAIPLGNKPPRFFNGPIISQHLVTLELRGVLLDGCFMDFSRCPLLEDLEISGCRISATKISSQSIRHLWIHRCEYANTATRLQVLAPNLFALRLERNDGLTPFLGSMPLLAKAVVSLDRGPSSFWHSCWRTDHGLYCDFDLCKTIDCYGSEKCGGLSNATKIELKIIRYRYLENVFQRDLKCCPPFSKLKTLVLTGWVDFHGLICFLQLTPILEKLILKIYDEI